MNGTVNNITHIIVIFLSVITIILIADTSPVSLLLATLRVVMTLISNSTSDSLHHQYYFSINYHANIKNMSFCLFKRQFLCHFDEKT